MSNVVIVETAKLTEKKLTLITGIAGAGFIGNTALMHIVNMKNLQQVSYFHGNLMPPLMIIQNGKPMPSFRVYFDGSKDILYIITEAMVSGEAAWIIGQKLMKWLNKNEIKEVIALDGVPLSTTGQTLFGFTTSNINLNQYNIQTLPSGAVSGINASILFEAQKKNIPWTSIFVPTQMITGADYQGAVTAVNLLNRLFNLNVNPEQLQTISDNIKKATMSQTKPEKKGGFFDRIMPGSSE